MGALFLGHVGDIGVLKVEVLLDGHQAFFPPVDLLQVAAKPALPDLVATTPGAKSAAFLSESSVRVSAKSTVPSVAATIASPVPAARLEAASAAIAHVMAIPPTDSTSAKPSTGRATAAAGLVSVAAAVVGTSHARACAPCSAVAVRKGITAKVAPVSTSGRHVGLLAGKRGGNESLSTRVEAGGTPGSTAVTALAAPVVTADTRHDSCLIVALVCLAQASLWVVSI
mmetsp:Transcript_2329/g.5461  ORF Transcript_2329/g.5461 Transcript_2329/m.5461 type:complete len:227 (+) Transcript_2329:3623-4303(+)